MAAEGAAHDIRTASPERPRPASSTHDTGHERHDHDDGHDDGHEHDAADQFRAMARSNQRRLLLVFAAGLAVMASEIVGGVLANSLVLLADAAHYATDLFAVALAFVAVTWAVKAATKHKTFGYQRAEVIAAFLNAVGLWLVSIYFVYQAILRLRHPPEVGGTVVLVVGAASFVLNLGLAWILHKGSGHNLNMRAAYLHVVSDVLGSAAALLTGIVIRSFGWHVADPLLTLFITILIVAFTWKLTKQTLHILLEGSPPHADPERIAESLLRLPEVKDVHDLHVWSLTSGTDSVSAHVVLSKPPTDDHVSHAIHERLREEFRIDHVTVQVESPDCPCTTLRHGWATSG